MLFRVSATYIVVDKYKMIHFYLETLADSNLRVLTILKFFLILSVLLRVFLEDTYPIYPIPIKKSRSYFIALQT